MLSLEKEQAINKAKKKGLSHLINDDNPFYVKIIMIRFFLAV